MIKRRDSRTFAGAILALALPWSFQTDTAVAAELDASVQQQIRATTFEVVQLKPPDGDVTYERPLPMELMPYQQRTDRKMARPTSRPPQPLQQLTERK